MDNQKPFGWMRDKEACIKIELSDGTILEARMHDIESLTANCGDQSARLGIVPEEISNISNSRGVCYDMAYELYCEELQQH